MVYQVYILVYQVFYSPSYNVWDYKSQSHYDFKCVGQIKMKQMSKKGITLGDAPVMALSFGLVILITAAIGLAVQSFQSTLTLGSVAHNVSGQGLNGLLNFSIQMPTIGTILGISLIIGLVVMAFSGAFNRSGGL